ncbi:MAG TPA: aminotransferase class I/II-fold pyridoxal phosphate-dependent enzyme [Spirochaetales bacterium]|nr:aminotransferase class I/II-fold pyridoxal phosphate-dependent enzyme [Spirochaetales bacterium]
MSKHYIFHGTQLSSDDIIITNGCQESVFLALLSICNPGDTVATETPIFFNFIHMLETLQLKILEIPCTCEEGMSIEALECALGGTAAKYRQPESFRRSPRTGGCFCSGSPVFPAGEI